MRSDSSWTRFDAGAIGFGAVICTDIQRLTLARQSSMDHCGYASGCWANVQYWLSAHLIHTQCDRVALNSAGNAPTTRTDTGLALVLR